MAPKIRIKDIAERAGVSVGTVDRVLHKRPNVSKSALEAVEKALKEMDYKPNVYASALAYNRSYTFHVLMPSHDSEAYWEEIEEGTLRAMESRNDFHIDVKLHYYQRFNDNSFSQQADEIMSSEPDGVVVVPSNLETTRKFTDRLHEAHVPFIMLDSYMPDLKPLAFFGQDSFASGYFAAKMLMMMAQGEKEIMFLKPTKNGKTTSKQQDNREVGFRHYMTDHFPKVKITELNVPHDGTSAQYAKLLKTFFTEHPKVHHCVSLSSKAYIVGEFLLKTNRRDIQIMGYDMVPKNAECLRQGSISFLIAQHAYQQGYSCVEALFQAIVLKKKVNPVNYMPIEFLIKENVEFYRRTQL